MIATSAKDVLLHRLVKKVINRCDILIFFNETYYASIRYFKFPFSFTDNDKWQCTVYYLLRLRNVYFVLGKK